VGLLGYGSHKWVRGEFLGTQTLDPAASCGEYARYPFNGIIKLIMASVRETDIPEIATQNAVKAFKEAVLSSLHEDVLLIVFFGSRRRGIFRPESDLDLLVVIKEKRRELVDNIFEIGDMIEQDILHYDIPITIHILSESEYNKFKSLKSPFIDEIRKDGLIIYERVSK
jgi:predicted nucleotidyltransferase